MTHSDEDYIQPPAEPVADPGRCECGRWLGTMSRQLSDALAENDRLARDFNFECERRQALRMTDKKEPLAEPSILAVPIDGTMEQGNGSLPSMTKVYAESFEAVCAERDALRAEVDSLPAKWLEDSSLKTWFPLTAEEIDRLRAKLAELEDADLVTERTIADLEAKLAEREAEIELLRAWMNGDGKRLGELMTLKSEFDGKGTA